MFFASQSPNDYQQKFFNFQVMLEFAYMFQCDGVNASSVQEIIGCNSATARDLQTELARLEPGLIISKSHDTHKPYDKFTAEASHRAYA